jgi:uncharacterized membrane protein YbhN (UPF0104 family)
VEQIKGKKLILLRAFVFNFLQRASLIAVTLFSFLAIGGDRGLCLDVWVAQSMVVLGSNTVPIPGAMGVADYLMLDVFGAIVAEGVIVNFELLSRSVSFYFCVITCGISFMTRCLISQFSKRRSEK